MSKSTDHFKQAIKQYLDHRAQSDPLFAASYAKDGKTIDGCISYIYQTVRKMKRQGFTDDEVYNMAVHYYDEDDLKANSIPSNITVKVNYIPELSEEEKKELHEQARHEELEKARMKLHKPKIRRKNTDQQEKDTKQPTLF